MARFLQIARGSATDVEYQVFLARDLQYLREQEFRRLSFQAEIATNADGVDSTVSAYRGPEQRVKGAAFLLAAHRSQLTR
jgi:hypothetical protein